jgi:hypothetical protein
VDKQAVQIFDVPGKDVPLFHYVTTGDDGDAGGQFVQQSRAWSDSTWETIAREYVP